MAQRNGRGVAHRRRRCVKIPVVCPFLKSRVYLEIHQDDTLEEKTDQCLAAFELPNCGYVGEVYCSNGEHGKRVPLAASMYLTPAMWFWVLNVEGYVHDSSLGADSRASIPCVHSDHIPALIGLSEGPLALQAALPEGRITDAYLLGTVAGFNNVSGFNNGCCYRVIYSALVRKAANMYRMVRSLLSRPLALPPPPT